jgi:anti-anti-sigma regulatory factor
MWKLVHVADDGFVTCRGGNGTGRRSNIAVHGNRHAHGRHDTGCHKSGDLVIVELGRRERFLERARRRHRRQYRDDTSDVSERHRLGPDHGQSLTAQSAATEEAAYVSSVAFVQGQSVMQILTNIEPSGAITLTIAGTFNGAGVADFERALDDARRREQPVFLDLTRVRFIDRPTLKYLIDLLHRDVRLAIAICPPSVERWIARESAENESDE